MTRWVLGVDPGVEGWERLNAEGLTSDVECAYCTAAALAHQAYLRVAIGVWSLLGCVPTATIGCMRNEGKRHVGPWRRSWFG